MKDKKEREDLGGEGADLEYEGGPFRRLARRPLKLLVLRTRPPSTAAEGLHATLSKPQYLYSGAAVQGD